MQTKNNLVVMLTHNDQTVLEAAKIFEQCRHSKAQFWGIKEVPLSLGEMKHMRKMPDYQGQKLRLNAVAIF